MSPDMKTAVLAGEGQLEVRDLMSGDVRWKEDGQRGRFNGVFFLNNTTFVHWTNQQRPTIYSVSNERAVAHMETGDMSITSGTLGPNQTVFLGTDDGDVMRFPKGQTQPDWQNQEVSSRLLKLSVSADGRRVIASVARSGLAAFDIVSGKVTRLSQDNVESAWVGLSEDGAFGLAFDHESGFHLWDIEDKRG